MRSLGISCNLWKPEAPGSCGSEKISAFYLKYLQKIDFSFALCGKHEFVLKVLITSFTSCEFLGAGTTQTILFISWICETEHTLSNFKHDTKLGEQLICWQAGRAVFQGDHNGLEYCASRKITKFNQGAGRLLHLGWSDSSHQDRPRAG